MVRAVFSTMDKSSEFYRGKSASADGLFWNMQFPIQIFYSFSCNYNCTKRQYRSKFDTNFNCFFCSRTGQHNFDLFLAKLHISN